MPFRRLFGIVALLFAGGLLVACGSEDADPTPVATTAPAETISATLPVEPEVTVTIAASGGSIALASPAASPAATPMGSAVIPQTLASPIASPAATPVGSAVIPQTLASPAASPAATPVGSADGSQTIASPEAVMNNVLVGTLTLEGREQQDYTLTDEGCVGLGNWRQLQNGAQVVVRNSIGTVVDIATLEASDSNDACMWSFEIEAPFSHYFSVSIPMVTEVWFAQDDPAVIGGSIELFVP